MSVRSVEELLQFKSGSVSLDDQSVYAPLDTQFQGDGYAQHVTLPLDEFVAEFPKLQRELDGSINRAEKKSAKPISEDGKDNKRKRLDIAKAGKFTSWKSDEVRLSRDEMSTGAMDSDGECLELSFFLSLFFLAFFLSSFFLSFFFLSFFLLSFPC
jgi:hypothetical protein